MGRHVKTKRSLAPSIMMIVMCLALLIGATYAWFTDTASTSVNKVQAGTLELELYYANNANGGTGSQWTAITDTSESLKFMQKQSDDTYQFVDAATLRWEPGATFCLPALKIKNTGNLALKYKVLFSLVTTDDEAKADALKLAGVLDVTMNGMEKGTLAEVLNDTDPDGYAHSTLAGNAETDPIILTVKMREDAGNEYQGLAIEGIAINVLATQDTVEYDSNGKQYDAQAGYPVVDGAQLSSAITNAASTGGIVTIAEGTVTLPVSDSSSTNKADISGDNITITGAGKDDTTLDVTKKNYTIDGSNVTVSNLTIKGKEGEVADGSNVINLSGDNTTLSGVKIDGSNTTTNNSEIYHSSVGFIAINAVPAGKTVTIENTEINVQTRYGLKVDGLAGALVIRNSTLSGKQMGLTVSGNGGALTAENTTFKGALGYGGLSEVKFTDCKFENGARGGNFVSCQSGATFTGCDFASGYTFRANKREMTINFVNCTYGGSVLTVDHLKSLFSVSKGGANGYEANNKDVTIQLNGQVVTIS